jgi:hypothetical protein
MRSPSGGRESPSPASWPQPAGTPAPRGEALAVGRGPSRNPSLGSVPLRDSVRPLKEILPACVQTACHASVSPMVH